MSTEFKPGDKVRALDSTNGMTEGQVYTVTETLPPSFAGADTLVGLAELNGGKAKVFGVYSARLELVERNGLWTELNKALTNETYDRLAAAYGGPKRKQKTFLVTLEVERINDAGADTVQRVIEEAMRGDKSYPPFWLREGKVLSVEKSESEA